MVIAKKNWTLFIILIALLSGIYVWEEIYERKSFDQKLVQQLVFNAQDLSNLTELQTNQLHLKYEQGQFSLLKNKLPVDPSKLQKMTEVLGNIKIKRVLSSEEQAQMSWQETFPEPEKTFITLHQGGAYKKLILGNQLNFDQAFYIRLVTKTNDNPNENSLTAIAIQDTPLEGVYSEEDIHRSDEQYQKLKSIVLAPEDSVYDLKVFRPYHQKHISKSKDFWQKMKLVNVRNRPFSIDFKNMSTEPKAIEGLSYDYPFIEYWAKLVFELEAKQLYAPLNQANLKDSLATMELTGADGEALRVELFRQYGSLTGYFLSSNFTDYLMELDQSGAAPFFQNAQDFWKLQLWEAEEIHGLALRFDDKEWLSFNYDANGKQFSSSAGQVQLEALQKLVKLLRTRADRVIAEQPPIKIKAKETFELRFEDRAYRVILEAKGIALYELKHGLRFDYLGTDRQTLLWSMKDYSR